MARISIPKRYRPGLAKLRKLSNDLSERLMGELQKCPPTANARDIGSNLAPQLPEVPQSELEEIAATLCSLYILRAETDKSPDALASDVCEAMQSADQDELKLTDSEYPEFRDRLRKLLDIGALASALKTVGLQRDFAYLFCDARILTDVRPVFGKPEERPLGCVIVHTLRLGYDDSGGHKEFYLALDADDIAVLKNIVERAETKAASLKALLKSIGMPELGQKP